jgi:hypothetical protein
MIKILFHIGKVPGKIFIPGLDILIETFHALPQILTTDAEAVLKSIPRPFPISIVAPILMNPESSIAC